MIAHRLGKADLRLPHAFGAALAAPVQRENDRPLLAVVAAPVFGQVDLKAVGDASKFDSAVQEAGLLRRLGSWRNALFPVVARARAGHSMQAIAMQASEIRSGLGILPSMIRGFPAEDRHFAVQGIHPYLFAHTRFRLTNPFADPCRILMLCMKGSNLRC